MSRFFQQILILFIRAYQLAISPLFPPACRHEPSCSRYAIEAIRIHGAGRGLWLAAKRLCRCHPWGAHGRDPVPGAEDKAPAAVADGGRA